MLRDPVRVAVTPAATTADKVDQRVIHRRAGRQARAACRDPAQRAGRPRARLHAHQARRRQGRARADQRRHRRRGDPRQQVAEASASARSRRFAPARCACSSRPTSPRAASTSTASPTSSTSICRTCRRATCTASAAPRAPAPTGVAISFCDAEERAFLRDIEKLIRMTIPATDRRRDQRAAPEQHADGDRPARPQQRPHQQHRDRNHGGRKQSNGKHAGRGDQSQKHEGRSQQPPRHGQRSSGPGNSSRSNATSGQRPIPARSRPWPSCSSPSVARVRIPAAIARRADAR